MHALQEDVVEQVLDATGNDEEWKVMGLAKFYEAIKVMS